MMLTAEELSEGAFDLDRYDLLTKMAERESRIIASLMTKLRITPQSTYDQSKKKPLQEVGRPWEPDED